MRFLFLSFLLVLTSPSLFAYSVAPSAQRLSGETAHQAYLRNLSFYLTSGMSLEIGEPTKNAYGSQTSLEDLILKEVPELESLEMLMQEFVYIRDTRFIVDEHLPFPRRLSWLYPDDGCFVRADLAGRFAQEASYKKPAKLFAFGDLRVQTNNSINGQVEWWYHVVIAYKVQGQLYVIDPSIEPLRPLTAREWGDRMGGTSKVSFALCDGDTYQPYNNCGNPTQNTKELLTDTQMTYLDFEWERLEELDRNPNEELGDLPPWKK